MLLFTEHKNYIVDRLQETLRSAKISTKNTCNLSKVSFCVFLYDYIYINILLCSSGVVRQLADGTKLVNMRQLQSRQVSCHVTIDNIFYNRCFYI